MNLPKVGTKIKIPEQVVCVTYAWQNSGAIEFDNGVVLYDGELGKLGATVELREMAVWEWRKYPCVNFNAAWHEGRLYWDAAGVLRNLRGDVMNAVAANLEAIGIEALN